MSKPTHLVLPTADSTLPPAPTVHLLPFHTPFSGPSTISTYFLTRPIPDTRESALPDATLLSSAFRGRQLIGQPLRVPEGYEGVVLSVPEKTKPVKQDRAELTGELEDHRMNDGQAAEGGRRVSPRKRKVTERFGAGAGPSKRPVRVVKKFRIDSDDEEDSDEEETPPSASTSSAIPSHLSPRPTITETSLVSSNDSTPLPTDNSAPASPPLPIVQDTRSRSPSPTPLSPVPQPDPEPTEDTSMLLPPPPPARELRIVSTFGEQGITLWSADDPVDEGRDEYFRCLGKGGWMELAGVLHQEESEDEA